MVHVRDAQLVRLQSKCLIKLLDHEINLRQMVSESSYLGKRVAQMLIDFIPYIATEILVRQCLHEPFHDAYPININFHVQLLLEPCELVILTEQGRSTFSHALVEVFVCSHHVSTQKE